MSVFLTERKQSYTLSKEQARRLLGYMRTCAEVMQGKRVEDGPKDAVQAEAESRATRRVLEADGWHLNYENGDFVAYR